MWHCRHFLLSSRAASLSARRSRTAAAAAAASVAAGIAALPGHCSAALEAARVAPSIGEYNANDPIEDRHMVKETAKGDLLAAVFDGHGGWQAADFAQKRLASVVQLELSNSLAQTPDQISGALSRAFLRVEREFLYQVQSAFELGFGDVARSGACALFAMIRGDNLFVANAGDCRAVLGRRAEDGTARMEAVALSNDHNAREPAEQAKLRALHPTEEDIIRCKRATSCYVKGRLQPTRSLGDAYLKYSEFNREAGAHRSAGRHLPPPYTPPYITADPEVQHHAIDRAVDEFVVLASDGLWDYLSNEEAVAIVGAAALDAGNPRGASDALIREVLERAARHHAVEGGAESLRKLPGGRARRGKHDDLTCVVIYLADKGAHNGGGDAAVAVTHDASPAALPP
ncbi:phosphatase 2C-like domain-containing protein [Tribonema minus]|uniref:Phosphatase 2C-like domain-containing protein n=1 Tax=Tribonema minus TaxID=303371 RepID=A0A835YJE2_9STRA|nr:phosphatase 2C-like domain-containing protein [Tribonema minus]